MLPTRHKILLAVLVLIFAVVFYVSRTGNESVNSLNDKIFSLESRMIDNTIKDECVEYNFLEGPPEQHDPKVLQVLLKRHMLPPSTLPYNMTPEAENRKYYPGSNVSSFHFIDYYAKFFFKDQGPGFFIDSGALDGDIFSNSLWLEKERGWNGVLIEVDPYNFKHLVWKRRKSWASNTCIAKVSYPQQPIFEFLKPNSSHRLPWVYMSNSRAVDSPFSKQNDHWTKTAIVTKHKIQCFPLASYLLALNVTTLDFLSLDIQGHEWDVIKTIPLDKVKVRVMAIEYYFQADDGTLHLGRQDPNFVKYMENIGYHLVDFDPESNYILVLKDDPLYRTKIEGKTVDKYYDRLKRLKSLNKKT